MMKIMICGVQNVSHNDPNTLNAPSFLIKESIKMDIIITCILQMRKLRHKKLCFFYGK